MYGRQKLFLRVVRYLTYRGPKRPPLLLPLIVFLVSFADLCLTLHFHSTSEGFVEVNPIACYFLDNFNYSGLVVFKITTTSVSCLCFIWILKNKSKRWRWCTSLFFALLSISLMFWWVIWIFFELW